MVDNNQMTSLIIPNIKLLMEMISRNIFRPLPILKKQFANENEEIADQLVDTFWPHIQPVYEMFLQLIVNDAAEVKVLKTFINLNFV